jgi:hypothetical protein
MKDFDTAIDMLQSAKLLKTARKLDVRVPAYDDVNFWDREEYTRRAFLNTTGRDLMRTRISEVKKRNFED